MNHDHCPVPISTTARPDPHDPALPVPAGSTLTAEAWGECGSIDQELYARLMSRFGPWGEGAAADHMQAVLAAASEQARRDVEAAFGIQVGDGGPTAINGALHLCHLRQSFAAGCADEARLADAERLMRDVADVVQWDLFHSVGAPDVVVFHGGTATPAVKRRNVLTGYRLYGGYSWTPFIDKAAAYGAVITATVLPVRLLFLSWRTPVGEAARALVRQCEVAPRDRLVLDPRTSTAFGLGPESFEGWAGDWERLAGYFHSSQPARAGREWWRVREAVPAYARLDAAPAGR